MQSVDMFPHENPQHNLMCHELMNVISFEHLCPLNGSGPLRTADDDIAICCSVGLPSVIRGRGSTYCCPGYCGGNNRNA
eukprot:12077939-Karenia_brevis.AAC.1